MNSFFRTILQKANWWLRINGFIVAIVGTFAAIESKENTGGIILNILLFIYSITLLPVCFKWIPSKMARIFLTCLYPIVLFFIFVYSSLYTQNIFYATLAFNGLLILVFIFRVIRFVWNGMTSSHSNISTSEFTRKKKPIKEQKDRTIFNFKQVQPTSQQKKPTTTPSQKREHPSKEQHSKETSHTRTATPKKNHYYYCEYCGNRATKIESLVSRVCPKHPYGFDKGNHKLYEGGEKSSYTCKYCGKKFPEILNMCGALCPKHPNGSAKGHHSPAL